MLKKLHSILDKRYGHKTAVVETAVEAPEKKANLPIAVPSGSAFGIQTGLASRAGTQELLKANHTWVYRAVQINAQNLAKQTIRLYIMMNEDREVIRMHPLTEVIRRPNPVQSRFDLWELTWTYLELTGNSYWFKAKDGFGVTRELWPIRPDLISPVPDEREILKGYLYEYRGNKIAFSANEIVHLMYPNPESMWIGIGPLQAARYLYDTDFFMRNWNIGMFKNQARPDGVLETDAYLGDEDIKRVRKTWHDTFGGPQNAHKTAVLQAGLKYNQISLAQKDLEFLESLKNSKVDIFEMFGVPRSIAGIVEDVNRANAEAEIFVYAAQTLAPRLVKMQERLSMSLAEEVDPRLFFEFDNPVPEDKEFKLKERESNLRNYVTDINEEREKEGRESVEWGNGPWLPFNVVQYGDTLPGGGSENNASGNLSLPAAKSVLPIRSIIFREDYRLAAWKAFQEIGRTHELAMQRQVRSLFREQKKVVMRNLRQAKAYKLDEALIDFILFDFDEWQRIFADGTSRNFVNAVLAGSKKAIADIAGDTGFDINSPIVRRFIEDKIFNFSFNVNTDTTRKLRDALEEGITLDEGFDKLAARVNKVFDFSETFRAKRIAVTEVNTSTNFGIHDAYRQSGIVEEKNWLSQRDGDTREEHQLDGEVIGLNETFSNGLLYPGDPEGDAGQIVNCRCTLLPVRN